MRRISPVSHNARPVLDLYSSGAVVPQNRRIAADRYTHACTRQSSGGAARHRYHSPSTLPSSSTTPLVPYPPAAPLP
eukprot:3280273-Rhodomonas_salina.1